MKKILVIICILVLLGVIGTGLYMYLNNDNEKVEPKKEPVISEDAKKFKEEYESLNGQDNGNGRNYRSIKIDENNPMIYKSADEVAKMIENKETFVAYFGYNSCPWCRSVLPTLLATTEELNIDKIYYVDIHDIRDVRAVKGDGEVETTKEGSVGYYKLLTLLDNVLEDYTLSDGDKKVSAGEKRIYAPNVVVVINGEAKGLTTGISEKQTDGYMDLTDDMYTDTYEQFKEVLSKYKNSSTTCSVTTAC